MSSSSVVLLEISFILQRYCFACSQVSQLRFATLNQCSTPALIFCCIY